MHQERGNSDVGDTNTRFFFHKITSRDAKVYMASKALSTVHPSNLLILTAPSPPPPQKKIKIKHFVGMVIFGLGDITLYWFLPNKPSIVPLL